MENRRWDRNRDYNERWDEYADRDRYERDYYQNRDMKPQGRSYDFDMDRFGPSDYHRYGTRSSADSRRYGSEYGSDRSHYGPDYGSTNYGYPENINRGYGRGRGHEYGTGGGYGRQSAGWGGEYGRNYGTESGYGGHRYGSGDYQRGYDRGYGRNRGDYQSYPDTRDYDRRSDRWTEDRDWWDRTTDEVASWFGDDEAQRRREMDRRRDHRGKGVKGYKISDERIKSNLEDELYHDSYVDPSDMTVSVEDGHVTLTGTVDNKWAKRRAEDLAETISGVKEVTNNLKVDRDRSSSYSTGTEATGTEGSMTTQTSHKSQNKSRSTTEA